MKKRKFGLLALAMEGVEVTAPEPLANELERVEMIELEASRDDVVNRGIEIDTGETIAGSVDAIIEAAEGAVESGEGLDQAAAAIANAALEAHYFALGFKPQPGRVLMSMEGLDDKAVRLNNTKITLEGLKVFRSKLDSSLKIAHESMVEKISASFTSASEMVDVAERALGDAARAYDRVEPRSEGITGGRWSLPFGGFNHDEVTSADVLARVKDIDRALQAGRPADLVNELTRYTRDLAQELVKGKEEIDPSNAMDRKITAFRGTAERIHAALSRRAGTAANQHDFEPLNKAHKSQLVNAAGSIAQELHALAKAWVQLEQAVVDVRNAADKASSSKSVSQSSGGRSTNYRWIGAAAGFFVFGVGALAGYLVGHVLDSIFSRPVTWTRTEALAYKNRAESVKNEARETYRQLLEMDVELLRLLYACVDYIKRSTGEHA